MRLAVLAACALALGACSLDGVIVELAERSPEVLYYVDTDDPVVALTIDDGPDPEATPVLLDVLARHRARATFFVIASRVAGSEPLLQRMLDEGHEIGNHSTRDFPSEDLSDAEFERDLLEAQAILQPFSPTRWFRPASGWYDQPMLDTLERHGFRSVLGSVYPFDPQIPFEWFARRFITGQTGPGEIIVLHDGPDRGLRTARVLDRVLPVLAGRGFTVTTLTDLVSGRTTRPR